MVKAECFATSTAVRAPTLPEIKAGYKGLMMVFMLSTKEGLSLGSFVLPADPVNNIGSAFKVTLEIEPMDEKEFIKNLGYIETEATNKTEVFTV